MFTDMDVDLALRQERRNGDFPLQAALYSSMHQTLLTAGWCAGGDQAKQCAALTDPGRLRGSA